MRVRSSEPEPFAGLGSPDPEKVSELRAAFYSPEVPGAVRLAWQRTKMKFRNALAALARS